MGQHSGTSETSIRVLDINDNAPLFERQHYEASVNENVAHVTVILPVKATDPDEERGDIEQVFCRSNARLSGNMI